jgi:FAD synthetase
MKKVMIFGVFDVVHDGHRAFLEEARKCGDYLVVAVAQDQVVERLKGHLPQNNLARRIDNLRKEDAVDEVALGDAEISTYEVVKKYKPDIIALGYDQGELKSDLEKHRRDFDWKIKIVVIGAHKPDTYHSSKLNGG